MSILEGLNPAQYQAVTHSEGPLLILAGPGSGKTRVIAHRIAYLVSEVGVPPARIMAVTFTNKAARELRERVATQLGDVARNITLGTFHSVCARILRIDGEHIGLPKGFVIFDDGDQMSLMKKIIVDLSLDPKRYPPRALLSGISRAKSEMHTPEAFALRASSYYEEVIGRAYQRYEALLTENNALDFDNILTKTVELLRDVPEVQEYYVNRYEQVMIDEFQDTNLTQYSLAKLIAPPPDANICVVGDPDQSIYSWRSADIRNILNFETDYRGTTVVHLEQNYRSTQTILDAATRIIESNTQRKEKELWTERGRGDPIVVSEVYNQEEEAAFVAQEVRRLQRSTGLRLADVAVMYRTNAQSRALEERFVADRLPYRLVGGTRFYERREIKDLLAYLRLILNPFDSISLARVLNVPARRIGDRTQKDLTAWADEMKVPIYTAMQLLAGVQSEAPEPVAEAPTEGQALALPLGIPSNGAPAAGGGFFPSLDTPTIEAPFSAAARTALVSFLKLLNQFIAAAPTLTVSQLLSVVIEKIGYRQYLTDAFPVDVDERWENVTELRNVAAQFDELETDQALVRFLEDIALMSDADEYDERVEAVTLITLHAAKGLEFPIVFMVGLEEGLLPHRRSYDDPAQMEEERRLCYVGVTRAKDRLYMLRATQRSIMGQSSRNPPSRFLADLPESLVHRVHAASDGGYYRPTRPRQPDWSTQVSSVQPVRVKAGAEEPRPRAQATYSAGERVRHAKFGEGIVISATMTASGADQEVVVAFRGTDGVKKLLLSFAPLEKLGETS